MMIIRRQSGVIVVEFGVLSFSTFPPWLGRSGSAAAAPQLQQILLNSSLKIFHVGRKLWLKGVFYLTGAAPPAQSEKELLSQQEGSVGII